MNKKVLLIIPFAVALASCGSNGTISNEVTPEVYQETTKQASYGYSVSYEEYKRVNQTYELQPNSSYKRTFDFANNIGYEKDYLGNHSYFLSNNRIVAIHTDGFIAQRGSSNINGSGIDYYKNYYEKNWLNLPSFDQLVFDKETQSYEYNYNYGEQIYYYHFENNVLKSITLSKFNGSSKYVLTFDSIGTQNINIPDNVRNYQNPINYGSEDNYLTASEAIEESQKLVRMVNYQEDSTWATPGYKWYRDNGFKPFYVKTTITWTSSISAMLYFVSDDVNNKAQDYSSGIILDSRCRKSTDQSAPEVGDTVYIKGYIGVCDYSHGSEVNIHYGMAKSFNSSDDISSEYFWEILKVESSVK